MCLDKGAHCTPLLWDCQSVTTKGLSTGQRNPGVDNLIAIADFFDVSLDYLVGRSDVKERR